MTLRETAVAWFMRMHKADPDHPDRGRFEAWLMADTSHAAVYGQVADVWEDFNSMPHLQSLASAMEQKEMLARQRARNIKKSISGVFGLVLSVERFQELARRLTDAGTSFVIEPYVRFEGEPGEQWTMFFLDPSGNALELKAFRDLGQLFAV